MTPAWILIIAFTIGMLWILYATQTKVHNFDEFAVGGRSYGTWMVGMSYAVSWISGTYYTGMLGLTARQGVFGFYILAFSILGVAFMYMLASRAWRWGRRFDLRSQPDLMGVRYNSLWAKRIASVIGIVGLFPFLIVCSQAMAEMFRVASHDKLNIMVALFAGIAFVAVRQYWTIRMGMRGLIMTDMYQGIICAVIASGVCLLMLAGIGNSPISLADLDTLGDNLIRVPGDGGSYGPLYMGSQILMGVVGTMCWPTSFQRVYTASSVRTVKSGTLASMLILFVFFTVTLLTVVAAAHLPEVQANPQAVLYTLFSQYGGSWMLALAVVIVLAANVGWLDGGVQVIGIQIANDLINGGKVKRFSDEKATIIAKIAIVGVMALAAVGAYFSFSFPRLSLFVQLAYEAIIQLGPALLLGVFWKRGNKQGAIAGMLVGFAIAAVLSVFWPDSLPFLGSTTSGVVGLIVNLALYVGCAYLVPHGAEEQARVDDLFAAGERQWKRPRHGAIAPAAGTV